MKKNYLTIILIIAILAQLVVPAYMIYRQEEIYFKGEVLLIKCMPVDPSDPFMGRYVVLNFDSFDGIPLAKGEKVISNDSVYVTYEKDKQGYVKFKEVFANKPSKNYLKAKMRWISNDLGTKVNVNFPFERFYMNENIAPEAERILGDTLRDKEENVYAKIRVLNGVGVVENVFFENKTLEEYVKEKLKQEAMP